MPFPGVTPLEGRIVKTGLCIHLKKPTGRPGQVLKMGLSLQKQAVWSLCTDKQPH